MAGLSEAYDLKELGIPEEHKFVFFSEGVKRITKVVQYTYAYQFEDRDVYNLGFGDYSADARVVLDDVTSSNGDTYKIFTTVLSTVPIFFNHFPHAIIMVQGSDSRPEYVEACKKTCLKRCNTNCRKLHQRISVYRNYVEKHFFNLSRAYWFLGGFVNADGNILTELYTPGRKYNAILFFRKQS